jgi:hypothetical protein
VIGMPTPRTLSLTSEQEAQLQQMRDTHALPYLRERAAALLKVAQGHSPRQVALSLLLRPRQPDTLYTWMARFEAQGIDGLVIRKGRGRKPAFSPSAPKR